MLHEGLWQQRVIIRWDRLKLTRVEYLTLLAWLSYWWGNENDFIQVTTAIQGMEWRHILQYIVPVTSIDNPPKQFNRNCQCGLAALCIRSVSLQLQIIFEKICDYFFKDHFIFCRQWSVEGVENVRGRDRHAPSWWKSVSRNTFEGLFSEAKHNILEPDSLGWFFFFFT